MRLIPTPPGEIVNGQILFRADDGKPPIDLLGLSKRDMRSIRGGEIAMVFQEPMTSLNPVYSVGQQVAEAVELHSSLRGRKAWSAATDMMRRVGIAAASLRAKDYPHQLSGGMRQRVMIAMALSCDPSLLIADEPTTALDVTVQAQILDLLRSLQRETGMSVIMITHDLGVVAQVADYVYVMYAGRIIEHAPAEELFAHPLHPYTQGLMNCVPKLSQRKHRLEMIGGSVPDPASFPDGCRFHPRCRLSAEKAASDDQTSVKVESSLTGKVLRRCVKTLQDQPSGPPLLRQARPNHFVACSEVEPTEPAADET
jgi:oligopeptide/dipeptide ABC transporter ATP-binding protein